MAWISPETLERWEDRWNRGTDKVMEESVKRPWTRWTVLPPTVFMDSGYVLRYLGVMAALTIGLQIIAQLLILPLIWSGQVALARENHDPPPSASVVLAAEARALSHVGPGIVFFVVGLLVLSIGIIVPRAYFWNRRARRLQEHPLAADRVPSDPSVWPPPPNI